MAEHRGPEGRERGWGSWGGAASPSPPARGIWGALGSPSGVWGGAAAEVEFGAF